MKKVNTKNLKKERGITLVALVVTIVVLLILAGVSINMVLGNNGLITKAKDAKQQTEQDQVNTETAMNNLYDEITSILGENPSGGDGDGESKVGTKFEAPGTIDGGTSSESNPTIPAGYIPINTNDAKWDAETGPEYNKGLVITDSVDSEGNSNGNEWVWVPVANVSTMYTEGEATLLGTSGDTAVTTSGYSNLRVRSGESSYFTATTPGNSSSKDVREPDLLSSYDTDSQYYNTILGFGSKEAMGEAFVADYEAMIASVSTYKGFYIGRYELTSNGEKAGDPLTNTNWYNLYKTCRDITGEVTTGKGQATMIWGCQWDETVSWLNTSGGYNIDTNSGSWGNYSDYNRANGYEEGNEKYEAGAGGKQDTGSSENWKANNIYDLAGNCFEWTQEAYFAFSRVIRGR